MIAERQVVGGDLRHRRLDALRDQHARRFTTGRPAVALPPGCWPRGISDPQQVDGGEALAGMVEQIRQAAQTFAVAQAQHAPLVNAMVQYSPSR